MMSGYVDCIAGFVQGETMHVHWCFFLRDYLTGREVEESEETVLVAPPGRKQPISCGMKVETLHERLVLVARKLVGMRPLFPVEYLEPRLAVQVIDVGDLAAAADR